MRVASEVSAEKLRGGFYTPDALVQHCLRRIATLLPADAIRVLEPSVGDGAFIRNLPRSPLASRIASITAIEPMEIEAEKARRALGASGIDGDVLATSAIDWASGTTDAFDAAIGNPPFVRYQFISAADRASAVELAARLGIHLGGVANLWIPVLLGALSRLRPGGAFAFVVPTECLTGCSAGLVRRWLLQNCGSIRFDLFPPGSFPAVLQEVAVLSGCVGTEADRGAREVRVVEHLEPGRGVDWRHRVGDDGPWTKYVLAPEQVRALEAAAADRRVAALGSLVAFEVSIVTGANDFFTVSQETVEESGLAPWALPLLPRIRHAGGLRYTAQDHAATQKSGARAWLLDFSLPPAPASRPGASQYVAAGEARNLHRRYKCRIREPWFRVPGIVAGELLLSKRSHLHPRVVVNEARVFTTDTIYRGRLLQPSMSPMAIAANFHNSLTLLSAELEGRSFGGGVLELVPSEIGRLLVLTPDAGVDHFARLDALARRADSGALIEATNEHMVRAGAIDPDVMASVEAARLTLLARRLDRNKGPAKLVELDVRPAA
jgi:adenine-specific DNA methylase